MRRYPGMLLSLVAFVALPATAEDAQSIMAKVGAKQLERWAGVDRYAVDQSVMGNRATLVYERVDVQAADGRTYPTFRSSPLAAVAGGNGSGVDSRTLMTEQARGMEMVGAGMSAEVEKGLEQAGLPPGLLKGMGGDPWVSPDPGTMLSGMAPVVREMAGAEDALRADIDRDTTRDVNEMAAFAAAARLVGTETVAGRRAFHLRAEGMNRRQEVDGQTMVLNDASLWIDAQEYVPLRSKVDGIATAEGQSRPITIGQVYADYRSVAGSRMYQSHRQSMSMAGVMSPAEQQEMRDASKQLDDLDSQLAQMPEGQRQMLMKQMGPQLETMRKMAAGEGVQVETIVHQIVVNPDPAALQRMQSASLPGTGRALAIPAGVSAVPGDGAPAAAESAPPDLKKAQQACLAGKAREAEAAKKKKRGLGSLMSAVGRVASEFGGADITGAMGDIYAANATAEDLASAARDLGLTEEDVAACQDP